MRVLLVSPAFHGYAHAIGAAFSLGGHEVRVHCYDQASSVLGRLRLRALHRDRSADRSRASREAITEAAIDVVKETRPDVVVTVKGDLLGTRWHGYLQSSGLPRVTWLYDELERMEYGPEAYEAMGPVASYSPHDVASLRERGVDAGFVPLGFDSLTAYGRLREPHVTFIGARYPSRETLLSDLHRRGVPVKAYGRDWSRHPVDVARSRHYRSAGVPWGRGLDRAQAYGLMAGSLATLNLHGVQDGFTMRTFEACGVGGLQICDRPDVDQLYEVGTELVVGDSAEVIAGLVDRAVHDPVWADGIRARGMTRTLAHHTLVHRAKSLELLWG